MNLDNRNSFESKNISEKEKIEHLIEHLKKKISEKFKLSLVQIEDLISFQTEKWLEWLKWELEKITTKQVEYKELADAIVELSKLREKVKTQVSTLKEEVIKNSEKIETAKYEDSLVSKFWVSKKLFKKCQNPENSLDQILWAWVWTYETFLQIWKFALEIGKWIAISPYHLYKLITWKAKYNWIKDI